MHAHDRLVGCFDAGEPAFAADDVVCVRRFFFAMAHRTSR
jgi:hypothetical protein